MTKTTWTRSIDPEGLVTWKAEEGDYSAVVVEVEGKFYGEGFVNRFNWVEGPWVEEFYPEPTDTLEEAQAAISPFERDDY